MTDTTAKQNLGILHRYFDEKGYGFLRFCARTFDGRFAVIPARDRMADTFVHQSDARRSGVELTQGEVYRFDIGIDGKTGKAKAENLKRVAP